MRKADLKASRPFPDFQDVLTVCTSVWTPKHYSFAARWRIPTMTLAQLHTRKMANFIYSVEGEIRLPELAITKCNQHAFPRNGKNCVVQIGEYIRVGDEILNGVQTPYSGQVIHINPSYVIIRRVYPYAMSHGSSLL